MSLPSQHQQAHRRQPQNRAESPEPQSRHREDTIPFEDSESDGDEYLEAIGTRGAKPYKPLGARQIPQTPQGVYSNCVAHAVATNIWLLLRHKYGERYTPNKRDILIIIMACCNGCGPTDIEDFLSDCRQHFNRHNAKPVNFMVPGGKWIQITVKYRQIPKFDHVVELLKAQPVLVSGMLESSELHLVCALRAVGEGRQQHLCAYHSWEHAPNINVYQNANPCVFQKAYKLDVSIVSVVDDSLIKISPQELLDQTTRPNQMTKSSYKAKHAVVVQHEPVAPPALRHTITAADSINAFFSVLTRATVAGVSSAITRLCRKRRREDGQ